MSDLALLRSLGLSLAEASSYRRGRRRIRSTGSKRVNRFNRKSTWVQEPISTMAKDNNEFFLASSDVSDHITTKLLFDRMGKSTLMDEITLLATKQQWIDHVKTQYGDETKYQVVHHSSSGMLIIEIATKSWMDCTLNANAISIRVHGTRDENSNFITECGEKFEIAESYIEWMYSADGNSVNVPLRTDRTPLSEMYPFLDGRTIEEYYDSYIESDASILLLIGPPGTGKTTFIRGLLQHTGSSAIVTYDAAILEKDYVFAQFIEGEANVMVMEDADTFLKARSDGNSMMHRFLNVGDGLVTTKGKKLVFSTNLPSIRDIDSALIRPGRCFDIVHFDELNTEQAHTLAKKIGMSTDKLTKDKYSIAELFNGEVQKHETKSVGRKVGFV